MDWAYWGEILKAYLLSPDFLQQALVLLGILLFVFAVYLLLARLLFGKPTRPVEQPPAPEPPPPKPEPLPRYFQKPLMTLHEQQNYIKLRAATDRLGLEVFTKVRLWDLIEPNAMRSDYSLLRNWISQKHIDFVVWNPKTQKVVLLLEILDSSHRAPDRKRRDEFVSDLADEVGYVYASYYEVDPSSMYDDLEEILLTQ